MKSENLYKLELTRSELCWLADVLGYIQFPLLGVPKKNESDVDMEVELKAAQAQIQERGLASFLPGSGWHAERLIIVLTQVIANPDSIQILETWDKEGTAKRAFMYPHLDFPLFVEDANVLKFIFHPKSKSLDAQKQAFFKLPKRVVNNQLPLQILNPEQIIPLLWNLSEEKAMEEIRQAGLDQQTEMVAMTLNQVTSMGTITKLISTEDGFETIDKKCLLWNMKNIWGGTVMKDITSEFSHVSYNQALKLLGLPVSP